MNKRVFLIGALMAGALALFMLVLRPEWFWLALAGGIGLAWAFSYDPLFSRK